MIKDTYYKLAVSNIYTIRNSHAVKGINAGSRWKFSAIFFLSVLMGTNIGVVWFILERYFYPDFTDILAIQIVWMPALNGMFNMLIWFVLPFMFLNYMLLLYHDRYELIIEKYESNYNRKWLLIYLFISWGIPLVAIFIFL